MWRFSVHFESCLNLRPLDGSIVILSRFTLWTSRHPERWTAMRIVWLCSRQHGAVQPKEWINHRLTSLILISRSIRCVTKNLFFLNRIRPFVTFILQNTPLMFHLAPVQCHTRFVYSRSSFNQPPLLSANQLSSPSNGQTADRRRQRVMCNFLVGRYLLIFGHNCFHSWCIQFNQRLFKRFSLICVWRTLKRDLRESAECGLRPQQTAQSWVSGLSCYFQAKFGIILRKKKSSSDLS